jgi:polyhydroxyalkanoate synthase
MSMFAEPARVAEAQQKAWGEWMNLWSTSARRALGQEVEPVIQPVKGDRRFFGPAWSEDPAFDTIKQAYLLAARQAGELIDGSRTLSEADKAQVEFFTRQIFNAASPANFP